MYKLKVRRYAVTEKYLQDTLDVLQGNADIYTKQSVISNTRRYLRRLTSIRMYDQEDYKKKMLELNS